MEEHPVSRNQEIWTGTDKNYVMEYRNLSLMLVLAMSYFLASCSTEVLDNFQEPDFKGYFISLTAEVNESKSRTHWGINEDNSLNFVWDASENEMKSFVKRESDILDFIDGIYSPTIVSPYENVGSKAMLEFTKGLSVEYQDGDVIWAVSPVSDAAINTEGAPSVEFTLPNGYVQTDITTTEHLKPYVFMTGTGTVSNNSASLSFSPLTAIYRFKIINNDTETLSVTEVGITGPFRNKVVVGVYEDPVFSVSSESNIYTIKVTTGDNGIDIAKGETAYLYALVFPTDTKTITDNITLYIKGKYGNVSADYDVTAACNAVYSEFNLESNKYYDMLLPVSRQGIVLGGVEINEFYPGGEFDITIDK